MYDVVFFEAFEEEAAALRACLPARIKAGFIAKTIQESEHWNAPASLISIRTQSEIPPGWASGLEAILSRSTGYDHLVSYRQATQADLEMGYLPLYCSRSVAEQAMLLWMALLRRMPLQQEHFATFDRDGLTGGECQNRTLLVVGAGHIGHDVAWIGNALGMSVRCVDIVERHPRFTYVDIDAGLAAADVVVCAMNLTDANRGYFTYDRLRQCKPGAIFVNVSRGEFVLCSELLRLLEERHLGGVGLDVYPGEGALATGLRCGAGAADEETRAILALAERSDAILTPHNAFNTREAVGRKAAQSIEQVEAFRATGHFKWPVP